MRILFAAILSLSLTSCTAQEGVTYTPAKADSLIQAHKDDSNFVLLDIRTPEEYGMGHLPDSRLLDFYGANFEAELEKLPRNAPILLYCRSGNRSGQAIRKMQSLGFTDVHHLAGGVISWQAEARPLQR